MWIAPCLCFSRFFSQSAFGLFEILAVLWSDFGIFLEINQRWFVESARRSWARWLHRTLGNRAPGILQVRVSLERKRSPGLTRVFVLQKAAAEPSTRTKHWREKRIASLRMESLSRARFANKKFIKWVRITANVTILDSWFLSKLNSFFPFSLCIQKRNLCHVWNETIQHEKLRPICSLKYSKISSSTL